MFCVVRNKTENHCSWVHNIAANLWLQCVVYVMLFFITNILYFYISTFRRLCVMPNMAAVRSSCIIIIIIISVCHNFYLSCLVAATFNYSAF